jgi:hypothetical protein
MNNHEEGGLKLQHIGKLLLCTENILDSKTIRPNEPFSMETTPFR